MLLCLWTVHVRAATVTQQPPPDALLQHPLLSHPLTSGPLPTTVHPEISFCSSFRPPCLSAPTSASFYTNIDCVFSYTSPNHFSVALLTLSPRHLTCTGCPSDVWISDPTHPLPHRWAKPRICSISFFRVGWRWGEKKKSWILQLNINCSVYQVLLRLHYLRTLINLSLKRTESIVNAETQSISGCL